MTLFSFALLFLATFYLSLAITRTSLPFGIADRLRDRYPNLKPLKCIVCCAPYCAVLFYGLYLAQIPHIIELSAIAGATVLLYRYTGGSHTEP
jgi:hypothetical protein